MAVFWISIVIGLIIVVCVIGGAYWFTHRQLRPHRDLDSSHDYLKATGKTADDALAGRPGDPDKREGTSQEQASAIKAATEQHDSTT